MAPAPRDGTLGVMNLALRRRLFLAAMPIVLLGAWVLGSWIMSDLRLAESTDLRRRLKDEVALAVSVLEAKGPASLASRFATLPRSPETSAQVYALTGQPPSWQETLLTLAAVEEVNDDRLKAALEATRPLFSPDAPGALGWQSVLQSFSGGDDGSRMVLVLSRRGTVVEGALDHLVFQVVVAAALSLLAMLLLANLATYFVTQELRSMFLRLRRAAGVDLAREPEDGQPLGSLALSIQALTLKLEQSVTTLTVERDRFEAVLERLSDAVIALDTEQRVTLMNRSALHLFGHEKQPLGRTLLEVARIPVLSELVGRAQHGKKAKAEFDWPGKKRRRLLARAIPARGSGGTILIVQDLTALRRLETLRRDFVANVSHELRTPVGVMLANTESLLDGGLEEPEIARGFVESLHRNAERLAQLVADLLDLSRLEAGQPNLRPEEIDLRDVLDDVVFRLASKAKALGVGLYGDIAEASLVLADAKGLDQVLTNLIDNAMKHGGAGARVHVRVRDDLDVQVLRVEVEDDGPGIEPAHRERIFERFYRVDPGRSREMGGTGLGLSIVKHLVENMGGTVGIETVVPRGCRFYFTLPRWTEPKDAGL